MKKALFAFLLLPFVFMACEKEKTDDKQQAEPNEFIISDTTYNLKEVFLNKPYTYRGVTFYNLYFNTDGVAYDTFGGDNEFTGNGRFLQLTLKSGNPGGLPTGSLSDTSIDYIATYRLNGDRWIKINSEWKTRTLIDVSRNGSNYTIKFSLTDSSDRKTQVKFTGSLKECDLPL